LWDLIVVGGGTSGVAAAISASKKGCKTLLIEKYGFLGGTATGALVTPMMSNMLDKRHNLTDGLYLEVLIRLKSTGHSAMHENGNPGWFDPELMKCILDDMCEESGVQVLFDTVVTDAKVKTKTITEIKCFNKSGFSKFKAKYFIDATGDADLSAFAGVNFESGLEGIHQSFSLRFIMANVNLNSFGDFLMEIDPESGVSSVFHAEDSKLLLTTAYTWDDKNWKLKPYFDLAVSDGVLDIKDTAYFQVFSIPGQKNALSFNCPRIYSEKTLNPLDMWDLSYAYQTGRKQIRRIAEFCKCYLAGFEESYISQIAPMLGIRDSRRIEGVYKLTEKDITKAKKFDQSAAKSNYPVDIHSSKQNKSELKYLPEGDYYEIPVESLIPKEIDNLYVVGRSISATFKAQASLRIQPNCWAMGEKAGDIVAEKLKKE
jgi:hypothetical protein